jgi:hypothetical protein
MRKTTDTQYHPSHVEEPWSVIFFVSLSVFY